MFDLDHLTRMLQQVTQFKDIPITDLSDFIRAGQISRHGGDTVIFVEDTPVAGLFVLLSGQVQLCRHNLAGQVSIVQIFNPVIMFNEVAALDGGPNPVTVIATQETTLWHISPQALQIFLLEHPRLCFEMLRILARRNRRLVSHFQDLSFRTVQARAAKLLLELSENGKYAIDRRKNPNHQLASRIATVPEPFSRALKTLRQTGAIEVTPQAIRILDAALLGQLARVGLF